MSFLDVLKGLFGKQNWNYTERRSKMRAKCRVEASLQRGSGLMGVEIRNVSIKGIQLYCLGKVRSGDQITLKGVKQFHQAKHLAINCRVEWAKKVPGGWLAGASFLDTPQEMSQSWLLWELKNINVKMVTTDQRRKTHRVKCAIPARLNSRSQNLSARIINLSPTGAMVQASGDLLCPGEIVTIRFGPLEELPKIALKASIVSNSVKGAPIYGVQFTAFEAGGPTEIKRYLDFFFRE